MTQSQWIAKRAFDVVGASLGLIVAFPLILLAAAIAARDTGASGFFRQRRVGWRGRIFDVIKIRTMRVIPSITTTATTRQNPRITPWGAFFRRAKIDELPQLWNVLKGDMSFVGPRPDVPGLVATIADSDRGELLSVRPGITGPATLRYRDEESLLAAQTFPDRYNREVIFPDKVQINLGYIRNYSLVLDVWYLMLTLVPSRRFADNLDQVSAPVARRAA